jgi:hypothetical protein
MRDSVTLLRSVEYQVTRGVRGASFVPTDRCPENIDSWAKSGEFQILHFASEGCDEERVTTYRQDVEISTFVGRAMPSLLSVLEELCASSR